MKVYAEKKSYSNGKVFLPCLSIMSPTSGSETQSTGYDDAEGQGGSTGNGEELKSEITQKHTQNETEDLW